MNAVDFARAGEEEALKALYAACFPQDEASFWDWLLDRVCRPEDILVIRREGRVVSSLQMQPCGLALEGRTLSAHYIYAAATLPEWQGRGLMGGLLEQAAREGRRRGQLFSVLITQEDSLLDYYARFGYQSRLLAGFGPAQPAEKGGGQARLAGESDLPALNALYEEAVRGRLYGLRPPEHWKNQLDLFGRGAWVWQRDGAVTGYAFADERGILEAAGPDAGPLAAWLTPGKPWRTIGGERPIGCIRPLTGQAQDLLAGKAGYLNLMYN